MIPGGKGATKGKLPNKAIGGFDSLSTPLKGKPGLNIIPGLTNDVSIPMRRPYGPRNVDLRLI